MYIIQHYFISQLSDSTVSEGAGIEPSAGILEQSLGAKRNRVGIGLSYRPIRLHRLAELFFGIDSWAPKS